MKIAIAVLSALTLLAACQSRPFSVTEEGQRWDAYPDSPEEYDGKVHHVIFYRERGSGEVLSTTRYSFDRAGRIVLPDGRILTGNGDSSPYRVQPAEVAAGPKVQSRLKRVEEAVTDLFDMQAEEDPRLPHGQ